MKITKSDIKKIILEEIENVLLEADLLPKPLEIKLLELVLTTPLTAEEAKKQLPEETWALFDYFLEQNRALHRGEKSVARKDTAFEPSEEVPGLEEDLDEGKPIGTETVVGTKTRTYDTKTGKMTKCVQTGDMKCPPVSKSESMELDEINTTCDGVENIDQRHRCEIARAKNRSVSAKNEARTRKNKSPSQGGKGVAGILKGMKPKSKKQTGVQKILAKGKPKKTKSAVDVMVAKGTKIQKRKKQAAKRRRLNRAVKQIQKGAPDFDISKKELEKLIQ